MRPNSRSAVSTLVALIPGALILISSQTAFALTKDQLSKCVKAEAKALRSRSILNMNEIETKILADPKSLRSFVEDSAGVKSKSENPIGSKLLKESSTCEELAEKWAEKQEPPRSTAEQIVEIFEERGVTIRAEDVEPKILRPALQKFNDKIASGFSLEKHPGLATLTAIYFTPEGTIALPTSPKISDREKKVGQALTKAQSADEAEQIIVIDTRNSLAEQLEAKLKPALKNL